MNDSPSGRPVEQIGPHLTCEWLDDRRIVAYTITDVSRDTIDQWAESIRSLKDICLPEHPLLMMYDASSVNASLTPYLRSSFQKLMNEFHSYTGRTVIIIKRTFMTQLLQLFIDSQPKGPRRRKIFFDREDGLNWLRQALIERK